MTCADQQHHQRGGRLQQWQAVLEDELLPAPSIGAAWQVNSKTVVRSGYAISFVRDTLTIISNVTTSNLGLNTLA